MIELLQFSKKYHQILVLEIPKWIFEPGVFILKGANGSGKSTLLQSMAARLPFDGQVMIKGVSLKKHPRFCREKVSYAAAEPLFAPFLTGRNLLDFFGNTKGDSTWALEELLAGFGADEFLDNATGGYSSGMLKKLALLLAFSGHPEWILLDEPYNGLDLRSAESLSQFIDHLNKAHQVSFIIASHQSHPNFATGNQQVLLIENGQLHSR